MFCLTALTDIKFLEFFSLVCSYLPLLKEWTTAGYLAFIVVIYTPVCIQHCAKQSARTVYYNACNAFGLSSVSVTAEPVYSHDLFAHTCSY